MQESLNMQPLPPLKWDDCCWSGSVVFSAWEGFRSRLGAYGSESATTESNGTAYLNILTPDDVQVSPSPDQVSAYKYLVEHQELIRDSILQVVFAKYPAWQEQYGYEEEDIEKYMPNIEFAEQLKSLIGLSIIHILSVSKNGLAYVGFEFGCTWDDEHGLGAMIHASRVVEVGGADTAFLEWIADIDAESDI